MLRRHLLFGGLAGLCGAFAGRKSADAQYGFPGQYAQPLRGLAPLQPLEPIQNVSGQTTYYGPSIAGQFNQDTLVKAAQLLVCGFEQGLPQGECRERLNLNVFSDPALRRSQRLGCYGIIMLSNGTKLANGVDVALEQVFDLRNKICEHDLEAAEQFLVAEVDRQWTRAIVVQPAVNTTIPAYQVPSGGGYIPHSIRY